MDIEIKNSPNKKGLGCWGYGCLISLFIGAAAIFGFYFLAKKVVETYTTTSPLALPPTTTAPGVYEAAQKKLDEFRASLDKGESKRQVRFTGAELNALLASQSEASPFKNASWLSIEGGIIKAKINLPLEKVGIPGRYINSDAEFTPLLRNGELSIAAKRVVLNGVDAPTNILDQIQKSRIVAADIKDPKQRKQFEALSSVRVENNELVLESK